VLATVLPLDVKDLLPKTQLKAVLPPRSRRLQVKRLQTALGFNLNLLRPPVWITTILLVTALVSLGLLFLNWKTGLSGLILSGTGLHLAWRLGTRFTQPTVGAVAQHMMTYQYAQSRRTSGTVNTSEVETVLKSLFRDQLGLEIQALSKEARFR
jgi:hypothetical protein